MLLKVIQCTVSADKKQGFSRAQQQWTSLKEVEGFKGQIGGWLKSYEAVIFSFWESKEAYDSFMEHVHDRIVQNNQQEHTYDRLSVRVLEPVLYHPNPVRAFLEGDQMFMYDLAPSIFSIAVENNWTVIPTETSL